MYFFVCRVNKNRLAPAYNLHCNKGTVYIKTDLINPNIIFL
jgi:hypothetical protein